MPTGYTATLCEQDQSFREFILQCARAFGACIDQRDDPIDVEPQKQEISPYHTDKFKEAAAHHAVLLSMVRDDTEHYGAGIKEKEIARFEQAIEQGKATAKRISDMISQVAAWTPPSPDHEELKKFMLQQLTLTLNQDGDTTYYHKELEKVKAKTPREFYEDEMESAEWELDYHRKEITKEQKQTKERNKWIEKLYQSLEGV